MKTFWRNHESFGNQIAQEEVLFWGKFNPMQQSIIFQTSPDELVEAIKQVVQVEIAKIGDQKTKATNHNHREVLTRKETAELLGVSLVTIHDWSRSGIIHPYKLGNRTYFKRSEIMEVLNQSNPKNHDRAK